MSVVTLNLEYQLSIPKGIAGPKDVAAGTKTRLHPNGEGS